MQCRFITARAYARAVLGVAILSVCMSVRLTHASPNDLLCVEWDVKPYTLNNCYLYDTITLAQFRVLYKQQYEEINWFLLPREHMRGRSWES